MYKNLAKEKDRGNGTQEISGSTVDGLCGCERVLHRLRGLCEFARVTVDNATE